MPLQTGVRLGHYEVAGAIGAGGMGEVYEAVDARLDRRVAIKILPASLASDEDRLRRFEREARATSALNHPNILTIHDFGTHDGAPYLVTELLDGRDLRAELSEGPLSVRKALDCALQICAGLAAAHAKDITHRDLKPENLFLTADGRVKILDFGLARVGQPPETLVASTAATGLAATHAGTVMGTVGYMSPEQVRGQSADHRSDIFSFGAILHEMMAGRRAFTGGSAVETMNAILKEEPDDLLAANPKVTPALDRIVRRCLDKRPQHRFQSAHDLGFALEALAAGSEAALTRTPSTAIRPGTRVLDNARLAWMAAGVLLAVAVVAVLVAVLNSRAARADLQVVRSSILTPPGSIVEGDVRVSPDGRLVVARLAIQARSEDTSTLWVRALDSVTWRPLLGTGGGRSPFWSPDSRSIGFFADGKLKRTDVAGGPVVTICDAPDGRGGSWNREGLIVFAPNAPGGFQRVSASGGSPTAITTSAEPERNGRWPAFLPDGRRFLYVTRGQVHVGSLDSPDSWPLGPSQSNAVFASGYLLFVRDGTLVAQPFDETRLEMVGNAVPLAEQVGGSQGRGFFTVSEQGALIYETRAPPGPAQLTWFDRQGKPTGVLGEPNSTPNLHLSPDGKSLAVQHREELWVYDVPRGVGMRFTTQGSGNREAVWSPDGARLVFNSIRGGRRDLFLKASDGTGREEPLVVSNVDKYPTSWSADGRSVLYYTLGDAQTRTDLWIVAVASDREPVPYLKTPFDETRGQFSPDGHWIAYSSNESGRDEVYLASFPSAGGRRRVSVTGGIFPRWRRDGRELFYVNADDQLMAVDIRVTAESVEVGLERLLFDLPIASASGGYPYDVTADGQRFLVNARERPVRSPPTLLVNWQASLVR